MKSLFVWACAAGFVGAMAVNALAAEGDGHKAKGAPKVPVYKGMVAEKAADAAANVAAILNAKAKGEEKKYNLIATDQAVIDQIKGLIGKMAVVKGTVTADSTGIEVTAIEEAKKPEPRKKKEGAAAGGQGGAQ